LTGIDHSLSLDDTTPLFDPTAPLTASGNLRRRAIVSRIVEGGAVIAALIAVVMMGIVVCGVVSRGANALSLSFVFTNAQGLASGGIFNYLLGTIEIVAIASLIAAPIGLLTGLYLTEFAGRRSRIGRALGIALDVLQGVPTIVSALFIYGLIVIPLHKESGFAGAIGLSIVILPLMARASQEVLLLVPSSLREAADSLGVARWRTVVTVILPAAAGGIVTGMILATARAAGETAPLLLLDSIFPPTGIHLNPFNGVPNVPMLIYQSFDLPVASAITRLWGAAFVLLVGILVANVAARLLLARSRARMGGGA
jgi:phosphate transport system permease protein